MKFRAAQDAVIAQLVKAPGVHGSTYGITTDTPQTILLMFNGWESIEVRIIAHYALFSVIAHHASQAHTALRQVSGNDELLAPIYAAVEKVDIVHVSYTNEA